MKKPLIGITMGDPAGIGPELCLRVLTDPAVEAVCVPVIFGDMSVLDRVANACGLSRPARGIVPKGGDEYVGLFGATVIDCRAIRGETVRPGRAHEACGRAAYSYVEAAVRACQAGHINAIATAPLNKEALRMAGVPYPGHTELLAALTGAERVCMMLASDEIVVSLVTTHVGLAHVPELLTVERIVETIQFTDQAMRRIGKLHPRITVCSLNPHGGEHGLFGIEEEDVIQPAIARALRNGIQVQGPLPPDTAFIPAKRKETDAYVVMYHDQGLIPFKMLAFDKGVNITLGLPIVRTSVDHGTAFDIAWQGIASPESLIQSVIWAVKLQESLPEASLA